MNALCWIGLSLAACTNVGGPTLSQRNLDAPFCYLVGGERCWPVFTDGVPAPARITLTARRGAEASPTGPTLAWAGLHIAVTPEGMLRIRSSNREKPASFDLELTVVGPDGRKESQVLQVRPAPPPRPLSYYADLGDDVISIFMKPSGEYQEITKNGFDQYFRRLQAQGISRLIIWLSPASYITDASNYTPEAWNRYEKQARAIITSPELDKLLRARPGQTPWGWVRQLLTLRLLRDFGPILSESARRHGIALTVSYRPFEAALTKYYEIPAFNHDGTFLRGFLPMASPALNDRPEDLVFAHYRTLLRTMGRADAAELATIEIPAGPSAEAFLKRFRSRGDNLAVLASDFPPLRDDSLVLERRPDGEFHMRRYAEIRRTTEARRHVVRGFEVSQDAAGRVRITGLQVPDRYRYLLLTNPTDAPESLELPRRDPVVLRSKQGNRLGRNAVYWVLPDSDPRSAASRVAGIPPNADCHSEFYAAEESEKALQDAPARLPLARHTLVIDRGAAWSVEMFDFNQSATRANAVAELKTILANPAVDEIFINTRSHTALVQGLDRAYAPRTATADARLKALAASPETVEQITTESPKEWDDLCRSAASPFAWRYARNRETAAGIRKLLIDLEAAFPGVRIRAVIPPSEQAVRAVQEGLTRMPRPEGGVYSAEYYSQLATTINHIPTIGEGMAMLDLSGLRTEPVVFGIRYLPEQGPLELYVKNCLDDLARRGSSFRGPYSFFYEAHETLLHDADGSKRKRREEITSYLLSLRARIREVIYYEAAAWTYGLPLDDPDFCGHGFLDRSNASGEPPAAIPPMSPQEHKTNRVR